MSSRFVEALKRAFSNHPLITNSLLYGTLCVGAEFSQQTLNRKLLHQQVENKSADLDWKSVRKFGLYGTFVHGPILVTWYSCFLSAIKENIPYDPRMLTQFGFMGVAVYPPIYYYWYRWLDSKFIGTTTKVITKKLLLDQFLLTPPLLVVFYVAMSLMENKKDILEECKRKLIPTFKTSCAFWLPVQAVNFLLVPPTFRVAYVGTCAFAWVNILCWFKRQE